MLLLILIMYFTLITAGPRASGGLSTLSNASLPWGPHRPNLPFFAEGFLHAGDYHLEIVLGWDMDLALGICRDDTFYWMRMAGLPVNFSFDNKMRNAILIANCSPMCQESL